MARLSPKTIGKIAHFGTKALAKTLRMRVEKHPSVNVSQPAVYSFWHDTHFVPVMYVGKMVDTKRVGLVSASKDGEILATWLEKLGYEVIRGSSSRKAITGVVKLIQAVRKGYSVGIALDGPRGPRHEAKAGASFIGSKTGVPLQPIGAAYSKKYQFEKSWDKFQLPLPFSKVAIYLGEPIYIPEKADMEEANLLIKQAIHQCEQKAAQLL